ACHEETADHEAERWPSAFHDELAILCGRCQTRISIRDYLSANDACPNCGGAFNPGCRLHRDLYFA
ncbi:hypothetical protein, partial [Pseudomonas sp. FW305-3-2-15-A-R2A1]|uniref:hypothetical protein n=1 Tax=Pseudomonas sp. FW305-3-2-15-A-R2A1 TaxID=2070607 RepID=UPI001C44DB9F